MANFDKLFEKLGRCRSIRNEFLKPIERFNYFLIGLLIFTGTIQIFAGFSFVHHDLWGEAQYSLEQLKILVGTWICFNIFAIPVFACAGAKIIQKRETKAKYVCIYGISLFLLVVLPMLLESSAFLAFQNTPDSKIKSLCSMTMTEIEASGSRLENALWENAHRFDIWSEQILDNFMCREYSCPCLDYISDDGRSSLEAYRKEGTRLLSHGRNLDKGSNGFMYFVKMEEGKDDIGFKSMQKCLNHKYTEAQKIGDEDQKVSGNEVAKNISQILLKDAKLIARRVKRSTQEFEENILQQQMRHLEHYLMMEDAYDCSGMCKSSLFFFGKDLHYGPPKDTCLLHLKNNLSSNSRVFAISSLATGLVALFKLLFSICLYNRPYVQKNVEEERKQQWEEEQPHVPVAVDTERAEREEQEKRKTDTIEMGDVRFTIE